MIRLARILPLLALLAGCAGSPALPLYTLQPVPGEAVATRRLGIELRRVGLAGTLDRPELVRGTRDFRLIVDDQAHWAEPLQAMLERVLTEDLVQRLPNASVFAESGAISTRPDLVLEIDIQRFDEDPDGTLVLLAQLALRPEGGTAYATTLRLRQNVGGGDAPAQAAAMSAVLGALADRIALQI
jgi:uncharacterized lipoprotein YmbA